MNKALKAAALDVLTQGGVEILLADAAGLRTAEIRRLRDMRDSGQNRPLAARLALLTTLGWRLADIAEAMDVSRVTLNSWLRDRTNGADTFRPYGPDALVGDPDTLHTALVMAPILNFLSRRNGEALADLRFEHDKFIVPDAFVRPLGALWRVAYKARGPELTSDPQVAAAGDALDILISILLRRGVTNLAIAEAAGVTHRAVLDRMNRARLRGLLLECGDDSCESFFGENDLVDWHLKPRPVDASGWLERNAAYGDVFHTPVRVTSPRPSKYWLQTMVDTSEYAHPAVVIGPANHGEMHARISIATNLCRDPGGGAFVAHSELQVAAALGRLNEDSARSKALAAYRDKAVMYVPSDLLYTLASERAGMLPVTAAEAILHISRPLVEKYFEPFSLVIKCFVDPAEVESKYGETVKHRPDAHTRRGNQLDSGRGFTIVA